jgi:hypothetical protein
MISECLQGINEPTELHKFYSEESVNNMPPLMICQDKRGKQNANIEKHMLDNQPVLLNDVTGCEEVFNVRNLASAGADLQAGYARNIDVDSELKRINYFHDACYYDNYKVNPHTVTPAESRLACHADFFPVYDRRTNKMSLKCLPSQDFKKFEVCPNLPKADIEKNAPVHYKFSNDNYCRDWPCQRLFHNQTKRSTILHGRHNRFDINPDFLNCCNTLRD